MLDVILSPVTYSSWNVSITVFHLSLFIGSYLLKCKVSSSVLKLFKLYLTLLSLPFFALLIGKMVCTHVPYLYPICVFFPHNHWNYSYHDYQWPHVSKSKELFFLSLSSVGFLSFFIMEKFSHRYNRESSL